VAEERGEGLPAVLAVLGKRYRVDFRDYRIGTLQRRTERRIELKRLSRWSDYLEYLAAHPEEVDELYRDLLIGVTSFFRDEEDWDCLAREVLPGLVANPHDPTAVRVWSAGCATGEEAYSLAMVLLEQLEASNSRLKPKVFASDASDSALAVARLGLYPASIEGQVSPERLRRFFRPSGDGFEVDRSLRDAVTFAAHDLLSDPPFARLDLVSCRNVLIYLEPATQERLLEIFHFSLGPQGILWLGGSESIGRRSDLFEEVSAKHRVYRAIGPARPGYHLTRPATRGAAVPKTREPRPPADSAKAARQLEKLVLERYTSPCVVVDQGLQIQYFYGPTDDYLTRPHGEAKTDLLSWVRPELYAKLRSGLTEAIEQKRAVTIAGMRLEGGAVSARVEIVIEPITSIPSIGGLFLVAFRGVPASLRQAVTPEEAAADEAREGVDLHEELHDTREELRTAVDQLRTATEEHSASYEELLSLNEELQSSNEEIEASKEELQSLNEELTTINRQLEERNEELRLLTADLNNLLVSANVPTLFLDRELRIRRFTPACAAVMRIVPSDVGRALPDIKMQVRDDTLLSDAVRVLADPEPLDAEVSTEDGRWFLRRVLPYRTEEEDVDGLCLTFHEVTVQKLAAAASEYARLYAEAIIKTSRTPLLVLDMDHRLVSANAAFYTTFQVDEAHTEGRRIYELGNRQWDIPRVRALLEEALLRGREIRDYDVDHVFETIGWRSMRLNAQVMARNGRPDLILVSIEDVTDLRQAEREAQSRAEELALDDRRKDEFLAMLGHELRNPLAALANGLDLMRLGGGAPEQVRLMMERQTRRMTGMLDQLLDVARVISGKFELTRDAADLTEAASAAVDSVRPLLESCEHELTISLPPAGSVLVLGDAVRLAQVIENLLGNAAKYTENGGRIWLTLEATHDTTRLTVRDTGIGMEPAVLAHMFDLFTQAPVSLHRAKGGLGLGLALVRSLVQMHGGDVTASSAGPGKGTEVVVTLPRLRRAQLTTTGEDQRESSPPAARRILVVDDEVDAADALVELLNLQGHQARSVADGLTALAAAKQLAPDVVLLDLGLPVMNGYEVAPRLRELLGEHVLLIALTGYQGDQARLQAAGFDGHLLKPTSLQKLYAMLAEAEVSRQPAT
jgi:two-component system, chemotaxis family, CheB/CheR fusion protein